MIESCTLSVAALGSTPYRDGLRLQESLVRARADGATGDWLLFPDHPSVLTVGRSASEGSLKTSHETLARLGIEVFEVARGGDVTWHGPGQLVGYTICDLNAHGRDLHRFLRQIEESLIRTLRLWGLVGQREEGRTGVWVEGRKIASIGVAVRRWVTYHGFALNLQPDLDFFKLIHPCGLRGIEMTSVAAKLGRDAPAFDAVRSAAATVFAEVFGFTEVRWATAAEAWQVAGEQAPQLSRIEAEESSAA